MRFSLLFNGRMPVVRHLPVSWYETENIHHLTVEDFRQLLEEKGVNVVAGCVYRFALADHAVPPAGFAG